MPLYRKHDMFSVWPIWIRWTMLEHSDAVWQWSCYLICGWLPLHQGYANLLEAGALHNPMVCSVYLHLHVLTNYLLQCCLVLISRVEERVLRQLTSNWGKPQKSKRTAHTQTNLSWHLLNSDRPHIFLLSFFFLRQDFRMLTQFGWVWYWDISNSHYTTQNCKNYRWVSFKYKE